MRPALSLEQAQALVRRSFIRLWEGGLMEPRDAHVWLLSTHDVESIEDIGSVEQAERVAESIAKLWEERNARPESWTDDVDPRLGESR